VSFQRNQQKFVVAMECLGYIGSICLKGQSDLRFWVGREKIINP